MADPELDKRDRTVLEELRVNHGRLGGRLAGPVPVVVLTRRTS